MVNWFEISQSSFDNGMQSLANCESDHCAYLPLVFKAKPPAGTTYLCIGDDRIAMEKDGVLTDLLADHLGSTSVVLDASGQIVDKG